MLEARTFDEVNSMITNKRAVPFEDYFSPMDLGEEEKEKRIKLAERMEKEFLFVMALLFTMQRYGATDYERARLKFVEGYEKAIEGYVDLDEYMKSYITSLSYDFIDATERHSEEVYYYSQDRAAVYGEEESCSSLNHQDYMDAIKAGKTKKEWRTMRDKRVRDSHREVDGKVIGIDGIFLVGNSMFRYCRDTYYDPDPEDVCGCRCVTKYY